MEGVIRTEGGDAQAVRRAFGPELAFFAGKAVIVAVVFVISVLIIAVHVESKISQFAQEVRAIGGPAFWKKVEQELDRAADPKRSISPEKKQKILRTLRAIDAQWKPFAAEAYSIFTSSEAVAPSDK